MPGFVRGGSDGNERLTASTAAVLLVVLALEGLTLLGVSQFLRPHIFLGLLLIPLVLLKLASTGWRMTSYYRRSAEYVRRGPPALLIRMIVAPVLVVSTIALIATGIAAAALDQRGLLLTLHRLSFFVWLGAMSIHVLTRGLKLPRLVAADWVQRDALSGRRVRQVVLTGTLAVGLMLALTTLPVVDHWQDRGTGIAGIDQH
ncbi:MAG TPA: hypothetical protein VH210_09990 [Gaiellaceae bacterium]|jgi:hypothetical protein|nr:hypothetical protein [Gaiellaceae bacterium]